MRKGGIFKVQVGTSVMLELVVQMWRSQLYVCLSKVFANLMIPKKRSLSSETFIKSLMAISLKKSRESQDILDGIPR